MSNGKPRIVKDYDKLDDAVKEMIKLHYPFGFEDNLVSFTNAEGKKVSALPFETDDRYYLVRMTVAEAQSIIEDDDDYDEDGNLTDEAREEYEDKYDDEVEVAAEEVEESDDSEDDSSSDDEEEDDDDKD